MRLYLNNAADTPSCCRAIRRTPRARPSSDSRELTQAPAGPRCWAAGGGSGRCYARPMKSVRPARISDAAVFVVAVGFACAGRGTERDPATSVSEGQPAGAGKLVHISEAQFERARVREGDYADQPDEIGGAWRMIEVPQLGSSRGLVASRVGWLAVSFRQLGDARAPSLSQSVLYRSTDGVRWEALRVAESHDGVMWRGVAQGNGTYLVGGGRGTFGNAAATWTSADAASWTEHAIPIDPANGWQHLSFAGERFFAFRTFGFAVSRDGVQWSSWASETIQPSGVAYGNGRYVVVGTGPVQVSGDGDRWEAHEMDCEAFGDCVVDPGGGVHPSPLGDVLFAEGRFHARERSSPDGESWQRAPGRTPIAYVSGRFIQQGPLGLEAYRTGGAPELLRVIRPSIAAVQREHRTRVGWLGRDGDIPEWVEVPFEDGLTCESATCLVIGAALLLVPPEGTPPLIDRVPRTADGRPLLSDECPVSSQVFCSDYAARRDCRCDPTAPSSPESCADVSQYRCEGAFTPQGDEWRVDEVAEGGCSCSAIDPNQPPTLVRRIRRSDG